MSKKKIKTILCFNALKVACFDENDQQIIELQKRYYDNKDDFLEHAKHLGYELDNIEILEK